MHAQQFLQADQAHALSFDVWQKLLQHPKRTRAGVADGQRMAVPACMGNQRQELLPCIIVAAFIVEKHVAIQEWQLLGAGRAGRDRARGRPAVDVHQVAVLAQRLHDPRHRFQLRRQDTAHVIVDADGIGYGREVVNHGLHDLLATHPEDDCARPELLVAVLGLHRQVHQHILAKHCSPLRERGRERRAGEDRVGDCTG